MSDGRVYNASRFLLKIMLANVLCAGPTLIGQIRYFYDLCRCRCLQDE